LWIEVIGDRRVIKDRRLELGPQGMGLCPSVSRSRCSHPLPLGSVAQPAAVALSSFQATISIAVVLTALRRCPSDSLSDSLSPRGSHGAHCTCQGNESPSPWVPHLSAPLAHHPRSRSQPASGGEPSWEVAIFACTPGEGCGSGRRACCIKSCWMLLLCCMLWPSVCCMLGPS
jgi:hypothetical protein